MRIIHVSSCENFGVIPVTLSHIVSKNSNVERIIPVEIEMLFQ